MKKRNNFFFEGGSRNIIIGTLIFLCTLFVLHHLTDYSRHIQTISYSTFLDKVEQDQVKRIHVAGQEVYGSLKDSTRFETVIAENDSLWEQLRAHHVEFSIANPSNQFSYWYLLPFLSLIFMAIFAWYFIRQARSNSGGGNGGSNIFSMGKSKARMFMPSSIKETFDSVAGAAGAKEELKDVVDFLKNPEKYERLGAKITRGVLLIGDPGNGKTLLARAVAGEANCPFFSISGSDFIEVFVGVGAARVRDLFAQARKYAPCIIFIDEIDAVGRHRGSGQGGGNDEREQTLNQLLAEMDGFVTATTPIIVIAATNRVDVLDKALLRPGRFDRHVTVPYPDLVSREQILELHAKIIKMSPEVDLKKVARGTAGFSGASLANLLNEAALYASKHNKEMVTNSDIEEARDKVLVGKENTTLIRTEEDLKLTAYHEGGHALIAMLHPGKVDPIHKVTILSRGQTLGVTWTLPEGDKTSHTKEELIAEIKMLMGGRAAEEVVFGEITTGASNDFEQATRIARAMVCNYGMSPELGLRVYKYGYEQFSFSEQTAERIDTTVQKIVEDCYKETVSLLHQHRDKLDKIAAALMEKETLDAQEVYDLLGMECPVSHSLVK